MRLTIQGEDVSDFTVYEVTVSTGRDDIYSQPDGSAFRVEFVNYQSAGVVSDEVILSDEVGQIFRGWITDIEAELQDDMSWKTKINATGPLAILGQLFAGFTAYPVETDSRRVKRIIDETALAEMLLIDTAVEGFNLSTRNEETEPVNAAELARVAAESAMGVLWEQPNSYEKPLRYTQAKYRTWDAYALTWGELPSGTWAEAEITWDEVDSDVIVVANTPPALSLDPFEVYATLVFEQTIDDLIRTTKVAYGPEDAEERPPEVIAGSGQFPSKSFNTILDRQGDAAQYATTILDRHSFPAWRLSSLTLDLERLPESRQIEIRNALQVGTRISITMPHGSPVGPSWQGFLEGWELDLIGDGEERSFIVDMNISDRFMTEPADRWLEVATDLLWQDINDDVTWADTKDVTVIGGQS